MLPCWFAGRGPRSNRDAHEFGGSGPLFLTPLYPKLGAKAPATIHAHPCSCPITPINRNLSTSEQHASFHIPWKPSKKSGDVCPPPARLGKSSLRSLTRSEPGALLVHAGHDISVHRKGRPDKQAALYINQGTRYEASEPLAFQLRRHLRRTRRTLLRGRAQRCHRSGLFETFKSRKFDGGVARRTGQRCGRVTGETAESSFDGPLSMPVSC